MEGKLTSSVVNENERKSQTKIEHNVFKNDPIYFKTLIGKKVEIQLFNDIKHTGELFCVDPVSESVILLNKSGDKYDTDIILGYTIRKIDVLSQEVSDNVIFQTRSDSYDSNYEERKAITKNWLNKNLINVQEDGESLVVGDDLTILPPYTVEKCLSNNTIILERIQKILSNMPTESL